ncbi:MULTISPECIES: PPOX class F420-dependent oxidoreductase [Thermocrispum]|jgi:hypothetical protein|uniref:PPOX class F420-dependent oxidoreductase n=1 Tax=Thermocrispum agreste TaxID=37925 RepID=A0A2W4JE31_9PSEU|nr:MULTISPECIES: PPOX class F420-dependent oxidoreductase [Thermocrispum]PZM97330.1 MAG: PPOX class F420-dependent oxidoreductase [Thermocrispum agreste]
MERLRGHKYVLLTTYRKSGTPVSTPVWFVHDPDDGRKVYVWSARDAGKVKRIRAGSRATLVACDALGKTTYGEPVDGTPRLLDDGGTERMRKLLVKKYGILGYLTVYGSILRGGRRRTIGIEIEADRD